MSIIWKTYINIKLFGKPTFLPKFFFLFLFPGIYVLENLHSYQTYGSSGCVSMIWKPILLSNLLLFPGVHKLESKHTLTLNLQLFLRVHKLENLYSSQICDCFRVSIIWKNLHWCQTLFSGIRILESIHWYQIFICSQVSMKHTLIFIFLFVLGYPGTWKLYIDIKLAIVPK